MRIFLLSTAAVAALFPYSAMAQDAPATTGTSSRSSADKAQTAPPSASPEQGNAIVVTGTRVRRDDILGNVNTLGGDSLVLDVRP